MKKAKNKITGDKSGESDAYHLFYCDYIVLLDGYNSVMQEHIMYVSCDYNDSALKG